MYRNEEIQVTFEENQLRAKAKEIFWSMAGFTEANRPSQYQKEAILEMRDAIAPEIFLRLICRPVQSVSFEKNQMSLNQHPIYCELPLEVYREQIEAVYLSVLTENEITVTSESVSAQLYIDMWKNAYLDAAREQAPQLLKKRLQQPVSAGVCPGFYGIPLGAIQTLYQMMEAEQYGITMQEGGYLLPEKTVFGLYFLLKHDLNIFGRSCESCFAKGKNCEFCMKKIGL